MTAVSDLNGQRIHRYTHVFQNNDDRRKKIQMLRLLGRGDRHASSAASASTF